MSLTTISGEIQAQPLNDNFSYLDSAKAELIFYDVTSSAYGATGNGVTDDTSKIQSAINAANAAGGGTIYFPYGIYVISSSLVLYSNINILSESGATIDASALSNNDNALEAIGTQGITTALTGNTLEGATSISADSTGFVSGDWCMILSNATSGDTLQPKGEIVRIESVISGSITLYDPLVDTYNTANNASIIKLNMIENIVIEKLTILGNDDSNIGISGLMFDTCRNITVNQCIIKKVHYTAINFRDTINFKVTDCQMEDIKKAGFAYGVVAAWASQDGNIKGCTGFKMRHLFASGGGTDRNGIPRRIIVEGCNASQMMDAGFDCHPGAEDISFIGNTVLGSEGDGITIQAASFICQGNIIRNTTRHAILIEHTSNKHLNGIVNNNIIQTCGNTGIDIVLNDTYNNYKSLIISNNTVNNTSAYGITIPVNLSTTRGKYITISNNIINTPGNHGIFTRESDYINISNNQVLNVTASLTAIYMFDCDESSVNGNITDGGLKGINIEFGSDVEIIGNRIHNASAGVTLDNNCSYCIIMGNNARGCITPFSFGSGTGHIYQTAATDKYNRD